MKSGAGGGGRQVTADDLSQGDVESAQSIGFWLQQAGLLDAGGPPSSGQQERDSMKLQISLLHQQLEEKNQQILQMEALQRPPNASELSQA